MTNKIEITDPDDLDAYIEDSAFQHGYNRGWADAMREFDRIMAEAKKALLDE